MKMITARRFITLDDDIHFFCVSVLLLFLFLALVVLLIKL